ncbi:integrase, catalytic region, zinc finger, CCHC-type containing protein [Tanacetum coccineum]
MTTAGNAINEPLAKKDPKLWNAEEKRIRRIDRLPRSLLIQVLLNDIYSLVNSNDIAKGLWDALERQIQTKNLMDINIDVLYNILKQNQGDVNDVVGIKKKAVVVTLDPLALVSEKTKVSKSIEKVVVHSYSEESDDEDIYDWKRLQHYDKKEDGKKRDMIKVKCYNCKKKGHFAKYCKKTKVKDYNYYKTKMLVAKKDSDEQVLLTEDQVWMELSKESSSSAEETIAVVSYYSSDSKSESEFETSDYYDKIKINYGLFVDNDDDQETFHDAIEPASENVDDNHAVSQKYHDESGVDHNDSEEKENLANKLIAKFNQKIAKCHKSIEKVNQQSKYLENQNKDLQDKNDVLNNQVHNFKEKSNEFDTQIKVLKEKDDYLLAQTEILQEQLKVKHVVIDTHTDCQAQLHASYDLNDLYVFDDMSIRKSQVSKMPSRKKPRDSLNVHSKNNSNNSLPRTSFRLFPKTQLLAKPVAKWIPKVKSQIVLDSGCSKHMTGNRALLINFVEKFLGMVRFGNDDFSVIAGYGDVVLGSMTIKKVYYVKGLGHNLFSVGQFYDKGFEVAFRTEDGVDFLTGDRSSNLYTIALDDISSNSSVCLLEKASSSQSCCRCYLLNDYDDVGKLKAKGNIGVFVRYSKESAVFRIYNKRTQKTHESVNVNFDEISEMASKQFSLEPGLSNLNKMEGSSNPTVSQVSETSKKDLEDLFHNVYDEYFDTSKITKSPTTNVETSNKEISPSEEEVFHEIFESFQEESSSSLLNDDVLQSSEEVTVPSSNTQSFLNEIVHNLNEASTSHNVFNERMEDSYFDTSTTFHDFIEPIIVAKALKDVDWVIPMQEELDQCDTCGLGSGLKMVDVSKDGDGTLSQPSEVGAGETLRSSFASKIRNVDGKILGKDGKPMRRAIRQEHVRVSDQIASDHVDNHSTSSIPANGGSFASILQNKTAKKVVKVSELRNNEKVQGAAVAIPLEAVKEVSACFDNTLYGYFVGKKLAFPLVENYVKNTWIKYGLERVMNKNGFFFFQFSTREGMEKVIENGPWLIRSVPLILNVWTPNAQVKKDEIKVAPVWVKLRHVPVVAYSEIGLSLITTQLGRPIMLDSYTCNMCINPWGKSDYARALVQVLADVELAKSVVVAIPFLDGTGHSLETVVVEYEWTPPRCGTCCIFDHTDDQCPKKPIEVVTVNEEKDVAWEVVCLPKDEGVLGIRRLEHFNSALMVAYIWKLLSLKESLWVKWIHEYKLKGCSFWDIPLRGNMAWGWRKLLQLRPIFREFIWSKIGDGSRTSLWFDRWCDSGPLSNVISSRDMFWAGLNSASKVNDVIFNGVWNWPTDLIGKYPFLNAISGSNVVEGVCDKLEWRTSGGVAKTFSVSTVWSSIRPRDTKVNWYEVVWFASCIPRHSFHMWLIVKKKLKTQDLLCTWDASVTFGSVCSLCEQQQDSHEHLFFECPFSQVVWNHMKGLADVHSSASTIYDIISYVLPIAKRRSSTSVIAKLVIAASAYFIWQERNWRLFRQSKRNPTQVIECITYSVRLKLLSCKFKKSKDGVKLARLWELPEAVFLGKRESIPW